MSGLKGREVTAERYPFVDDAGSARLTAFVTFCEGGRVARARKCSKTEELRNWMIPRVRKRLETSVLADILGWMRRMRKGGSLTGSALLTKRIINY